MITEDIDWTRLSGGYRVLYDPRNALGRLESGEDIQAAWKELWSELYHQGDVGDASYAAVPHLVRIHESSGTADWNTYALIAAIEHARHNGRNPQLSESLRQAYEAAWLQLVEMGLRNLKTATDASLVASIIGVVAMGKNLPSIGYFAVMLTEDERAEILENHR